MPRQRVTSSWVLVVFLFFVQSAQAFFDQPWITPVNPIAGEAVSVNVHGGICDSILGEDGFPQTTREGNAIHIVYYGTHYEEGSDLCHDGVGTVVSVTGVFQPGDYALTVDLLYRHPFLGSTILNIGVVQFTVAVPPPSPSIAAPALNGLGLFSLLVLIFVAGARVLRIRHPELLITLIICMPFSARAVTTGNVCVIPSGASGSPTPEQIMAWINSSPRDRDSLARHRRARRACGISMKFIALLFAFACTCLIVAPVARASELPLTPEHPAAGQPFTIDFDYVTTCNGPLDPRYPTSASLEPANPSLNPVHIGVLSFIQ